jgi:glycosidase
LRLAPWFIETLLRFQRKARLVRLAGSKARRRAAYKRWTFEEAIGQYYYHAYLPQQPDLNWRNPEVRAAMLDVLSFWLARGLDGFRVDAIRHLLEDARLRDNPVNPEWFKDLRPVA